MPLANHSASSPKLASSVSLAIEQIERIFSLFSQCFESEAT